MGKRRSGTPESEVEEAAARMAKYPEFLEAAETSKDWADFLDTIGIDLNPNGGSRVDFFEKVRDNVNRNYRPEPEPIEYYSEPTKDDYKLAGISYEEYTKHTVYRDVSTGRFISKSTADSMLENL